MKESAMPAQPNRLAQETSPYLLQHAHNPVDWYPWGEEAFQKAQKEDKPILLSVGYSACHWCHVMERESFENEAIAAVMNEHFVNIKVDREERPDVDAIYMNAVQALTQQGGWPMTVFLTPEGRPFFGGTYFPPEDRYGHPGFRRVLEAVAHTWQTRRDELEAQGQALLSHLDEAGDFARLLPDSVLTPALLDNAYQALASHFDARNGGFGGAPKFPQPANLDFLLRTYRRTSNPEPLAMVEKTLQRMALGGIYDQLGGGFHRYSTDAHWLVPHFEKMLYDNAQLAQVYLRAYQATGNPFYRVVAEETLEYVLREMTAPEGGFFSAQDADSEGVEGKFFVWTPEEVQEVLGERDAAVFSAVYDVTPPGNWEGKSILNVVMSVPEAARKFGLSEEEIAGILERGQEQLFAVRERRIKPGLDDKILTAWNGLMLSALAEAAAVLDRDAFRQAALRNAEFVLAKMTTRDADGHLRLLRTYRNGTAKLNGYLEDYAFYAEGLCRLYEATFDVRWLDAARSLVESMLAHFGDSEQPGFFATSDDHETLIQRLKDWDDNATPGGNSVAVEVLLRLAHLIGDDSYRQRAEAILRKLGMALERHPLGFARMLGALDFYLSTPKEIALIGDPVEPETQALIRAVFRPYLPNKVVALALSPEAAPPSLPLLADRPLRNGHPTAYVCENFTCKEPVTDPAALETQLTPLIP
ncbi:MAG TPA: thioredoxin domain-containing protein [Chthonomonadaceae bacterium]|nr:thioredoxin domain-containing protein [Chthonomonadaceae bacterium]